MTRVVIVDDLKLSREQLTEYLEGAGIEVVGTAGTGQEAIELVAELDPDVVTMDVRMPGMDGIEATRRIVAEHPTPVVVISRLTKDGAETTLSALGAGAVDHFHKLGGDSGVDLSEYKTKLVETVEQAAEIRPEQLVRTGEVVDAPTTALPSTAGSETPPTVVIASSTGGVGLLERQLSRLPADADLRVLVVQHLRDDMTVQFADRLDETTPLPVRESTELQQVGPGEVVVAHGGRHLAVTDDDGTHLRLSHTDEPADSAVVPAADVTMTAAADVVAGPLIGVVLTGLGRDGVEGARAIAAAGGTVVAQSEASSPADWMPRHVREAGLADHVCDADRLIETITEALDGIGDEQ